jgi:coenzyme F420 hydrogenase subunit beta
MIQAHPNVGFVPENGLCTMCSTCAGICPQDAINMKIVSEKGIYQPVIDATKCTDCGLCVKCCPGLALNWVSIERDSQTGLPVDPLVGIYSGIYRAYCKNSVIRENGASGGVVTGVLSHLFEKGIISGAVVTRMDTENPLDVLPYVAFDQDDLLKSQKSKYCPVPMNKILRTFLKEQKALSGLAFVGLPCQVAGLRLAETELPQLRKTFSIVLSLFCHHTPSRRATEYLLYKNEIRIDDLREIIYRDGRQVGNLQFLMKNGNRVLVSHLHWTYWGYAFMNFFIPTRCWLCRDKTGKLADISFGDNWQRYGKELLGMSTIITRSATGEKIIWEMGEQNRLMLESMEIQDVIRDQDLIRHGNIITARTRIWRLLGRKAPNCSDPLVPMRNSLSELLGAARAAIKIMIDEKFWPLPLLNVVIWCCWRFSLLTQSLKRNIRKLVMIPRRIIKRIIRIFGL